jgi:hypothetical protein
LSDQHSTKAQHWRNAQSSRQWEHETASCPRPKPTREKSDESIKISILIYKKVFFSQKSMIDWYTIININ